jgi:hypothetical protein
MPRLLIWILPIVLAMAAQPTFAQSVEGPLAPGKAAGIQAARSDSRLDKLAVIGAIGLGVVAVYLIVGTHYHNPSKSGDTSSKSENSQSASGTH